MKNILVTISIMYCLLAQSCKQGLGDSPLFELMDNTGIDFVNSVKDNDSINIINYRNFYNGGGVGIGDINNDGLADVFFTANQGSNKLFLNKGKFTFEDISTKAGFDNKLQFSTGVVMADINHDGWLDIYVCNAGSMTNATLRKNELYINNHDLTFTESAGKYGLDDSGYTTQASFFDYDLDGDLDCFLINNSPVPVQSLGYPQQRDVPANEWRVPEYLKGGGDQLLRNDNGFYKEVTREAGIHGTLMSFGLGVTVGDINGDHYPDVYVSNDFFERDYLYINQRDGSFKDELETSMQHNSYASMGADVGDINNDGHPEIFTTDMLPADDYRLKTTLSFDDIDQYRLRERNGFFQQFLQNTLQLNDGQGGFKDIANYSGVNASEWSWGALMLDADNDGLNDLFVCNGIYRDLTNQDFLSFGANEVKAKMLATGTKSLDELVDKIPSIAVPNMFFHNKGNLKFTDEGTNWGFGMNSFSNGAAYADLDNDGDLDLVVSNVNEPCFVYRNNSREQNKNHFVGVTVKGTGKNPFAIGTKILVYTNSQVMSREVIPSRGFQSSVGYKQVIGTGSSTQIDSIIIIWPNATYSKINKPASDQYHSFTQPENGLKAVPLVFPAKIPYLVQLENNFDKHADDDYTDFYQERGIPQMLSHEGPKAAVADVNGDGLEDVYIGGTVTKEGSLYIQKGEGEFVKKDLPAFSGLTGFVDAAILFFDADADGDKDLLVCSGGNAAMPGSRELQHRLFMNDGKGGFQLSSNSFPANKDNIAVAVEYDLDNDGDLDLFIGARCVTGVYGISPQSHIYINNGKGIFSDLQESKMQGLVTAGMITSAVWADVAGDAQKELIIAGEWMNPKIFQYKPEGFVEITSNLSGKNGWWQSVVASDVNGDGRVDLVLGNIGENFYLHPDAQQPVKLWIQDFDGNGQLEKVITRRIDGKDKPVFMKNELESGLPGLKKQNLLHSVYATKSIQELFPSNRFDQAIVKEVNYASSCVAINNGHGNYTIQSLPAMVQLSSVKCLLAMDVNQDGFVDMIAGGNEFTFQPQLGRLDASEGDILINDGKGSFSVIGSLGSGLRLKGEVRDIVKIKGKTNTFLLFLRNNELPVLYKLNK